MTMTVSEMKDLNNECCQRNCSDKATHVMYWPGQGRKKVCTLHKDTAIRVAMSMGFTLTAEELVAEEQTDRPRRSATGE